MYTLLYLKRVNFHTRLSASLLLVKQYTAITQFFLDFQAPVTLISVENCIG
jgi:hypothetical protein